MSDQTEVVIHALLGVENGVTEEASVTCRMHEVPGFLKELDEKAPHWQAITIVHLEDHVKLLEGVARNGVD